jgi:hypothetical protein
MSQAKNAKKKKCDVFKTALGRKIWVLNYLITHVPTASL